MHKENKESVLNGSEQGEQGKRVECVRTILYIITNCVCVRASVRPSDDVLGAFSVAEPATEIF